MKATLVTLLFVAILSFAGCQAKDGERCDGFFTNTCKSPASCVHAQNKAFCANSCGAKNKCPEGYQCVQVTHQNAPVGGHCLPKDR